MKLSLLMAIPLKRALLMLLVVLTGIIAGPLDYVVFMLLTANWLANKLHVHELLYLCFTYMYSNEL